MEVFSSNLGWLFQEMGDDDGAIIYYQRSLEHAKTLKKLDRQSYTLKSLGLIYQRQKKFALAEQYFGEAIPIFKDLGKIEEAASTLNDTAFMVYKEHDLDKALEMLQESYALFTQIGQQDSPQAHDVKFAIEKISQELDRYDRLTKDFSANL